MAEARSLQGLMECALQVGDFGDAINWPTPGEIAHKSAQVSLWGVTGRFQCYLHIHIRLLSLSQPQSYLSQFFKGSSWYNIGNIEIAKNNYHLHPCSVRGCQVLSV